MSSEDSSAAPASAPERPSSPSAEPITFTVKSNNDTKYTVSIVPTASIADLKAKLAEMADVPADRQRLIYSGRVMKNEETLQTYKVKSGNTVHMVKAAASSAASQGTSATPTSSNPLPTMASGTANNPLAGLTGARYAGHVQLPGAEMFGADGGMGAPPNPEEFAQAMQNPMVRNQVNELLSNPQLLDLIIQSNPMLQQLGPEARQLMQSDMFRQMIMDPDIIRQMSGAGLGGMGAGGAASFPAPGATDTTPADSQASQTASPPPQQQQQQQQNPPPANPLASLFGGAGGAGSFGLPPPPAGGVPNLAAMQEMLAALQAQAPGSVPNPYLGGLGGGSPAPPVDNRPPEERYAEQLRQLNDMGFFDFDANVAALRRSGGSVQGAVNQLLGG